MECFSLNLKERIKSSLFVPKNKKYILKKVLIISYYWPPSGGAGVQRWLKFAKYLPEFGWEPHVYTPSNPEAPAIDNSLLKEVPKEVVVVKKEIFEPYSFYKKFTGNKGNVNAGFLSENEDSRKKFTEKLSIWIRGNFFIPDARVMWVKPSVKFLSNYIKENNIKVVVSTGPPHSMHLIAKKLKKKNKIKWIADFRDPWTNIDFYKDLMLSKTADKKHHRLEKSVLQQADKVITIGKTMAEELEVIRGGKVNIITNGYDISDFDNPTKEVNEDSFIITHVGSINADRNHDIFWKALYQLCDENKEFERKLKLIFVGKIDYQVQKSIKEYNFTNKIQIISYLPHNEITNYLFNANCLYLPLNNTPNAKGVLSGKFFEYLATNLPILGIGHPNGDAAEIMEETKAGFMVDFNDLEQLKISILAIYNSSLETNEANHSSRDKYSRKELTKELVKLL